MERAKKSLSQNFLNDKNISKKIINQTNIKNKNILEIGAGYGFMTDEILKQEPKSIIIVEKDFNLIKFLNEKYKKFENIVIFEEDILNFDLSDFKNLTIISNLPYNVSTKIILYLFKYYENINEMIFMIQKEVAKKFDYNLPKMNKYKFLTKIVSNYNICFDVSPKVFKPKPKVISSVVKFKINKKNLNLTKAKNFSENIFKNVRKMIYKNIKIDCKHELLNKRVNELTINELLIIYNLF